MKDDEDSERLTARERRNVTLKKVSDLFARNGFSGTSTADLAEAAGISEAMLFKLFETKEKLYAALIEKKIEGNDTPFPREKAQQREDMKVFEELGIALMERDEEDKNFMRLLLYSALEENDLSDMFFEKKIQKLVDQLRDYIETRIEEGAFREVNPQTAALGFIGMFSHYMLVKNIFQFSFEELGTDREVAEYFTRMTLKGLCK